MSNPTIPRQTVFAQVGCGLMMGAADVVPGVSGGTVALLLGIYERLVMALSRFDMTLVGHVRGRQWRAAARHIDLAFLVALGAGIGSGVLAMTFLMNALLTGETTYAFTMAVFFGLILATGILVTRMVEVTGPSDLFVKLVLGLAGAAGAWWLTTMQETHVEPSLPYLFACGAVAICAMILPGISGAMLLLILGVYVPLTDVPKNLLHGEEVARSFLMLLTFGAGCAIGLLGFSKVLRWLLSRFHDVTLAVLAGVIFGALRKIWPFQHDRTPAIEDLKHKQLEPYLPTTLDGFTVAIVATMVAALIGLLVAYRFAAEKSVDRTVTETPGPS